MKAKSKEIYTTVLAAVKSILTDSKKDAIDICDMPGYDAFPHVAIGDRELRYISVVDGERRPYMQRRLRL